MEMKICQSCAMPMTTDEMFGTNEDGSKNEDYCTYCYQGGEFTSEMTMEEMVEFCIEPCLKEKVFPDADTARSEMMKMFPNLKRWAK
jgi:hypothetical protein